MNRFLSVTAVLATLGASPALAGADPFLGEIMLVGYTFCPKDWVDADGRMMSIQTNAALFSLYGCTYGGDCQKNFALPDLRGRVAMNINPNSSPLPPAQLGEQGGSPSTTLTVQQLPAHTHQLFGTSSAPAVPSPSGALVATFPGTQTIYVNGPANVPMSTAAIGTTGNNQAVSLYQPYLVLRYCVALAGVYPSRN